MGPTNTGILTTAIVNHLALALPLVSSQAADAELTNTGIGVVALAKHQVLRPLIPPLTQPRLQCLLLPLPVLANPQVQDADAVIGMRGAALADPHQMQNICVGKLPDAHGLEQLANALRA